MLYHLQLLGGYGLSITFVALVVLVIVWITQTIAQSIKRIKGSKER